MMNLYSIAALEAREVLDSRGYPTVAVQATLVDGTTGSSCVPAGASTGSFEAVEKRDGDPGRYGGRGVLQAVAAVHNDISAEIVGWNVFDQAGIDRAMIDLDGTPNKSRLGANAILGTSMAVARAAAAAVGQPLYRYLGGAATGSLPVPLLNVLNGGGHADNNVDIQEFMLVPHGFDTFQEALRAGAETFHALRTLLLDRGLATGVGDEGGFAPDLTSNEEALKLLVAAVEKAGYRPGEQVALALDVAATELIDQDRYRLQGEQRSFDAGELTALYRGWLEQYPIFSIEDAFGEEDWGAWQKVTEALGNQVQLVGDDLFVTHPDRLRRGLQEKAANAILIKLNQIGTLTETLQTMRSAQAEGFRAMVSHRSGETADDFIADLAVAADAGQIKAGAPSRGERVVKYNRLLAIEAQLGETAAFAGSRAFRRLDVS